MPTPESEAAFKKLVAAREQLTEVTRVLNEARRDLGGGMRTRATLYRQLQITWEQAYPAFVAATDEFQKIVHSITTLTKIRPLPEKR